MNKIIIFITVIISSFFIRTDEIINNKPNVILINMDDLGWYDVGFNGHPYIKTPFLDSLAGVSRVANTKYSGSAVCSPSRAVLMTGLAAQYNSISTSVSPIDYFELPQSTYTIAEMLQNQGYTTIQSGKWHLSNYTSSNSQGNFGDARDHGFDYAKTFSLQPATLTLEQADTYMQNVPVGQPYFLYADLHETHSPITSFNEGARTDSIITANRYDTITQAGESIVPHWGITHSTANRDFDLIDDYYAAVTNMDSRLEQYFKKWRNEGRVNANTIIIFTSDNGFHSNTTGAFGSAGNEASGTKTDIGYKGGILVPGIFNWEAGGWNDGQRFDGVVTHYDIMPMLANILDCDCGQKWHGEDIKPIIDMKTTVRNRGAYWFFFAGNHRRNFDPNGNGWEQMLPSNNITSKWISADGQYSIVGALDCMSSTQSVGDWIQNANYQSFHFFDIINDPLEITPITPIPQNLLEEFYEWDEEIRKKNNVYLETRRNQVTCEN